MYQQLDCIALRAVKYNDRHSILSVYTRQRGRMSMLIPAGNGREASRRRAMIMPGSRFQCVADVRDNGRIPPMRDVMPRGIYSTTGDPVKAAVTLFLADFLNTLMRDSMPDEQLFDYCDMMLEAYGAMTRGLANFHLLFLIRLMHFTGIEPDTGTYRPGYIFDMMDGVFRPSAPLHGRYLERREADVAYRLMRMSLATMPRFKFSAAERNVVLDRVIEYYTIHFASLQSMKSLDVLRSLFK